MVESVSARSIIEMSPPARSPSPAAVRAEGPSRAQSPQNAAKSPVYRLQRARNSSSDMEPWPAVFVRQTLSWPRNIVFDTFGSLIAAG